MHKQRNINTLHVKMNLKLRGGNLCNLITVLQVKDYAKFLLVACYAADWEFVPRPIPAL